MIVGKFLKNYIPIEQRDIEVKEIQEQADFEILKYKNLFKEEKKKKEFIENQLESIKSQIKNSKKEKEELEVKLDTLKNQIYNLKLRIDEQDEKIMNLQLEIERLLELVELKNTELEELSKNQLILENERLKTTNERLLNRVQTLNQQYIDIENKYKQIERDFLQEKSFKGNFNSKENVIVENIKNELRVYKEKVKELENNVNVNDMVDRLKEYLSEDTLEEFENLNGLLEKFRKINLIKEEKLLENERRFQEAIEKPEMGYIIKENKHWRFYNLENKSFEIIEYPNKIVDGIPAKAAIIDSTAILIDVYSINYNREENVNNNKKSNTKVNQKSVVKDEVSYSYFGNFKVLIIGSRNKTYYIERLQKHGVEVVWHDPYEESIEQLKSKFRSADIVLVCKRHIPHDVTNIIDIGKEKKVMLIDRDNKDIIAAKTYYLAQELNLLEELEES